MTIKILAFGIAREICAASHFELEVPDACDTARLKLLLLERFPALERLTSLALAINEEYAPTETRLKQGDEIALIPPVSGG